MAVAFTKTRSPTDSNGVASSGGVSTYNTVSIGTASSDRIVLLGVVTEAASATINSVTIDYGGGAVAMKAGTAGVIGNQNARLFWLPAPTGTTATFAITYGAAVTGGAGGTNNICVYAVTGAVNVWETGAVNDTDADPMTTAAITVPANGGLFVLGNDADDTTARTLTGVTEDIDADAGAMRMTTGTSAGGSITATISGANTEDGCLSYIVFGPTAVNFGDVVGVSSGSTSNIAANNSPSRDITVSTGDLIFVNFCEAANLTATGCTDNLGNSFSALASGDGGNPTIIGYYAYVTVAGDSTPVVAATSGTDDLVMACIAYKGPFDSSPLDANPAVLTDSAEPYTSNLTGTLAQADELVVGYFSSNAGETSYDTPAQTGGSGTPTIDFQIPGGAFHSACITSLVVSATTSLSMSISGAVGSRQSVAGVATFKKGSTGKTLAASAGSFAFTGTAASLEFGRKLPASAGSFAFTGSNATLQKNLPLHASAGSFVFTGTDATLRLAHKLAASAGSFAFTGTDASLEVGYKLPASAGSFAFTGTDATFSRTFKLAASAGSFAFSGTDASLEFGHKLAASAGSFAFTGSDATLTITPVGSKTLAAGSGSFAFTGSDATLSVARKLSASAGSFAFTGDDASPVVTRILIPEVGEFIFTGDDATLTATVAASATPAALYGHWRGGGKKRRPQDMSVRLLSELDPKRDEPLFDVDEVLDAPPADILLDRAAIEAAALEVFDNAAKAELQRKRRDARLAIDRDDDEMFMVM